MDEVKNIMNDVYLAYKQYKSSNDLKKWNERMSELRHKYPDSTFYEDLAMTFARQVSKELGC